MEKAISNDALTGGITTFNPDGTRTFTFQNLTDSGYTSYLPDGRRSFTYKNVTDDGFTTYHPDGGRSITYKNLTDSGYTTYHPDGRRSVTYKDVLLGGYVTYYYDENGNVDKSVCRRYSDFADGGWIMSSIDKISNELMMSDSHIKDDISCLEKQCCEIAKEINIIKTTFGDQEVGEKLIKYLYEVLRNLVDGKNRLYIERDKIRKYVCSIRG